MRLTVERDPAHAALTRALAIVERRNTIPILSNVCLEAGDGALTIRATNLDTEAVERVEADISEPGQITVPADRLKEIAGLSSGEIGLTSNGSADAPRLGVRAGSARYSLPALPAHDFPAFPAEGLGAAWRIDAGQLGDMLARVAPMRSENASYTIWGTLLQVRDGKLWAVACNDSAIAARREAIPAGCDVSVILPPKLGNHLARWLTTEDGEAEVSTSGALIRVSAGGSTVTGKLLDGEYSDFTRLLIDTHDLSAKVWAGHFRDEVRRVLVCGEQRFRGFRCEVSPGKMALNARSFEAGEATGEVECEYDGPARLLRFNGGRLLDALGNFNGSHLDVGFSTEDADPKKTSRWKVVLTDPEDAGFVVNLMEPKV